MCPQGPGGIPGDSHKRTVAVTHLSRTSTTTLKIGKVGLVADQAPKYCADWISLITGAVRRGKRIYFGPLNLNEAEEFKKKGRMKNRDWYYGRSTKKREKTGRG